MFKNTHSERRRSVQIIVDGNAVEAFEGEMVAGVLARLEPFFARTNPVSGETRAPYCMMGVCFECLVEVDGVRSVQSCMTAVRSGMNVVRQYRGDEVQ